jgi:hypothetical protein
MHSSPSKYLSSSNSSTIFTGKYTKKHSKERENTTKINKILHSG